VQQELAEAKIQVQKRDVRIQMLENELRHQSRFKESRSEVLTSHSGYFRGNYDQQEESLNNLTTVSELTPTEMMMPELKESATSLSFDSAIFGKPASNADEHRPLINMDFRLPEFNKSRLFGGKKVLPAEVPLKPITHNQLSESDFAGITKTKTVLAQ
jgi:tRNA U55 pseudouridine synthase TruB